MSIAGISNFRDFGGLPVAGGRILRGKLFRSAAPDALTAEGAAALGARVAAIVDLRGRVERGATSHPGLEDGKVAVLSTPIEPQTSGRLRAAFADGSATAAFTRAVMLEAYRAFARDHAARFGDALVTLVTDPRPVLVHCTAGKDRTGFIVAVLQAALGAQREDILADYLETNRAWDRASLRGHLPAEHAAMGPVLAADADYLDAAFDELARHFGDVHRYVATATAGRVTPSHLSALIEPEMTA